MIQEQDVIFDLQQDNASAQPIVSYDRKRIHGERYVPASLNDLVCLVYIVGRSQAISVSYTRKAA